MATAAATTTAAAAAATGRRFAKYADGASRYRFMAGLRGVVSRTPPINLVIKGAVEVGRCR